MQSNGHKPMDFTPFMQQLLEESTGKFQYAYCREDMDAMYAQMTKAAGTSAYASRRAALIRALGQSGLECSGKEDNAALEALIGQVPCRQKAAQMLLEELYAIYKKFPTSQDYMQRLVRRLGDPEFAGDSVRLAIVKQFIKHTDYNTAAIKTFAREKYGLTADQAKDMNVLLRVMDEGIFEALDMIQGLDKARRRDARRKFALLKLADDLAFGRFRTNGKTKTDLYMFAFAFGMTAFNDALGDEEDLDRDVTKNLFRDYYQDNLLRYISEDYLQNFRAYDSEPTGEGINYKNYTEIIYLYYLGSGHKKLDARTRIKKANQMIEICQKMAQEQAAQQKEKLTDQWLITDDYNAMFVSEIWNLEEDKLAQYLCDHFYIPTMLRDKSRITVQWEEYSALNNYLAILDEVDILDGDNLDGCVEALLLDETVIGSAALDADFLNLMKKMRQLLRLRRPSPVVALACVMSQEGDKTFADRIVSIAAGLDCLENRLRLLEETAEAGAACRRALYQKLADQWNISEAKKDTQNPNRDLLQSLWEQLNGIRIGMNRIRVGWEQVMQTTKRAMTNFRSRAHGMRLEPDARRDLLTVCSNLKTAAQQLRALQAVVGNGTEAFGHFVGKIDEDLLALEDRTGVKISSGLDTQWCRDYAQGLLELETEILARLQGWASSAFAQDEQSWELPVEVETQMERYRQEQAELERISRTALIAVHYHRTIYDTQMDHLSMPQLLGEFRTGLDPVLDACRFQRISQKNLFDMFVLFLLYYQLNMDV